MTEPTAEPVPEAAAATDNTAVAAPPRSRSRRRAAAPDVSRETIDHRATRTLYPTGNAHIVGDALVGSPAAVVTHANPAAAERMLSYSPPAFSTEPTDFSRSLAGTDDELGVPEATLIAYQPPATADNTSEG